MSEKTTAYKTMEEFVDKYYGIIKPAIKKGNTKDLFGMVDENKMKFNLINKKIKGEEHKPWAHFRFAINLLAGLVNLPMEISKDTFNYSLELMDSQIQKLNKYLTN